MAYGQQQGPVISNREQELESTCAGLQAWMEKYKQEAEDTKIQLREAQDKANGATKHQSHMAKGIADAERRLAEAEKALGEEREVNDKLRRRVDEVSVARTCCFALTAPQAEGRGRRELEEIKKRLNNAVNEKHNLNERLSLVTVGPADGGGS